MKYQQFIIATGGVGVGKSTLIRRLKRSLPKGESIFVKEYVDYKPVEAKKQLEDTLKGNGSVYEFQLSIIDCYKQQMEQAQNKKYVIMERSPADSINIFAAASYRNGKISEFEFEDLKARVEKLYDAYNIPRFDDCHFTRVDSCKYSIEGVFELVKSQVSISLKRKQSCIFFLYCSDPLQQKRNIETRGRPEEKDYDINYMISVNDEYQTLFAKY
ncbi:hypothetical protein EDI_025730 [Entamoeba dispar SAW760]|uniref:Deoxynucleoside kinase domain-containing protein n=1 Tax=Entamoeba dispar (strain ATCC PRA-260 / SAW760) TaxID=370354 RepID=B0EBJ5_ENTDS|nr:uncharacterized protein EDI_025730 [Entamoeba dispar SAW760]EDR28102.1 hypothetical protein EDI_025730 [Entamoeba dispar SAW760]|eukprot:EDR28102.1 hypothetical protein EDI_025730 [Entamoeba dispar SAW760]